jgi:hypothetical protein
MAPEEPFGGTNTTRNTGSVTRIARTVDARKQIHKQCRGKGLFESQRKNECNSLIYFYFF